MFLGYSYDFMRFGFALCRAPGHYQTSVTTLVLLTCAVSSSLTASTSAARGSTGGYRNLTQRANLSSPDTPTTSTLPRQIAAPPAHSSSGLFEQFYHGLAIHAAWVTAFVLVGFLIFFANVFHVPQTIHGWYRDLRDHRTLFGRRYQRLVNS
ncbi:protein UL5 [Panine betaherpesvirus 2]|uniref:Protein UL5 n=1 Tax=Panine betaherpesvirus 2 TaxID=188763 RepID=Q8QS81_9BETA|nr:protein UL5 [Panine betaherpesvirus 2]AAM00656.1 protein UL5 [Panine betaherpesvirus 2]QXV67758.1 protein UL5 [Panine betaherpesvirus 2]